MEYLELVLLITMVVTLFKREQEKVTLEDKVSDIEGKLDGIEKLLVELQPKGPIEIPVRLDDELVGELLKNEVNDKDDTQYEGTEHDGANRLTGEQAQEILENIKYRKANRLK